MDVSVEFGDNRVPRQLWARMEEDIKTGCWIWFGRNTPTGWPAYNHKSVWRLLYSRCVSPDIPTVRGMACESAEKECMNLYHRLYVERGVRGVWSREEIEAARPRQFGDTIRQAMREVSDEELDDLLTIEEAQGEPSA